MTQPEGVTTTPDAPAAETVRLVASDVTRSFRTTDSFDAGTPAGVCAAALARRFSLPENTPWSLRNDATGGILADAKPIGQQVVGPEAQVTLHPRTHLGRA